MNSSDYVTDDDDVVVIVSLNISDTNITINGSMPKLRPNDDTSINNIIFGIGVVVVALFLLLIIIKLIYKCYKIYQEEDDDDDDKKDKSKQSPLLPSPSLRGIRQNSPLRRPSGTSPRSSLNLESKINIKQKRLSQTYSNTPPMLHNP